MIGGYARNNGMGIGSPPKSGFSRSAVELIVIDQKASLAFWTGVLGFAIAYSRPAQKFAYLERPEGAQVMIYERDGEWETGPFDLPLGRGVVIQVSVDDVGAVAASVTAAGVPFFVAMREKWRDWGDRLGGQREFLVQDPDGYLVMISQGIGTRPLLDAGPA
jgi:catechol 2,3-dioxygenase-like lactoylglutathione lyase family enzyme